MSCHIFQLNYLRWTAGQGESNPIIHLRIVLLPKFHQSMVDDIIIIIIMWLLHNLVEANFDLFSNAMGGVDSDAELNMFGITCTDSAAQLDTLQSCCTACMFSGLSSDFVTPGRTVRACQMLPVDEVTVFAHCLTGIPVSRPEQLSSETYALTGAGTQPTDGEIANMELSTDEEESRDSRRAALLAQGAMSFMRDIIERQSRAQNTERVRDNLGQEVSPVPYISCIDAVLTVTAECPLRGMGSCLVYPVPAKPVQFLFQRACNCI